MGSIEELARRHARLFPGFELVHSFDAGFPVFRATLNLLTLQPQPLPVLAEFLLRSVKAGITHPSELGEFLGLDEDTVFTGVADLLQSGLLKIGVLPSGAQTLALSKKGEAALLDPILSKRETVSLPVLVDGLTGELQAHEAGLLKATQLKKVGLVGIHKAIDAPTEVYFDYPRVKTLLGTMLAHGRQDVPKGDLLDVIGVEKIWCEYRRMSVLVFSATDSDEFTVAVFLGNRRMPEYESTLLRMEKKGIAVIPTERRAPELEPSTPVIDALNRMLPARVDEKEATDAADRYAMLTDKLEEVSQTVERTQETLGATQHSEERARLQSMLVELQGERERLEKEIQEYKSGFRLLRTYDHRPLLEEALTTARDRVIVISPWVKADAVDSVMIDLIERALQRKVEVVLGYGISPGNRDHHQHALNRLRDLQQKKHGERLRLVELGNTHEKILVCDQRFAVVSSFNFLSFRGSPDRGFREERGVYVGFRDFVGQIAEDALRRLRDTGEPSV